MGVFVEVSSVLVHRDTGPSDASAGTSRGRASSAPSPLVRASGQRRYQADFSLALINRTGAYHVAHDLVSNLPEYFAVVRYWRVAPSREPQGKLRWLLGKAMLFELDRRTKRGREPKVAPKGNALPTLFLDPLYVLRAGLTRDDVVLCHDVGPVTHPSLFDPSTVHSYQVAYERIVQAQAGIVFVSEASQRAFTGRFGEDFRFLRTIPLYVRQGSERGDDKPPPGIRKPFLLTVGALEVRKNYPRIIEAFGQSGLAERGYTHVICGARGNAADVVARMAKEAPAVQAIGYCTDAELRWLYRNASGFVLPSLLEGFGLPGLEAAKHRLLSLVSADTAQEEAVAGGAVLVDPLSVASIASGMRQLVDMSDAERQAKLGTALQRAHELTLDAFLQRWSDLLGAA